MGLRKWVSRPLKGHHLGVENLIRGGDGLPEEKRRRWTLKTIDEAPFQVWVVVVAGIGFMTDAFGLFALNVVTPMLGYVYWPTFPTAGVEDNNVPVPSVPSNVKLAMMCSTLGGTMIGQIGFGFAADILGRRKMYGLELVIIIIGTMLLLMSSNGEYNSMAVGGWLITWRAIMGIGIGADYPLSAVITAEFAPRRHRARMISWVFFAQPMGQLLANVLSLAAVEAYKPWIEQNLHYCPSNEPECFRAIDRLWRLVVGIGIVPAVIALAFRFTIPESPRYTLDILQNTKATLRDTANYFDAPELHPEHGPVEMTSPTPQIHVSRRSSMDSEIAPDEEIGSDSESERRPSDSHLRPAAPVPQSLPGDPNSAPPLASIKDAKQFFIAEGNWQYLLGTSLSWLFLDFAFYGLGLSSPQIVAHIWDDPDSDGGKKPSVFKTLSDNSLHTLVMVSIGTTIGGLLMVKVVKYVSPKTIQFWGFLVLFVLFLVTGSAWTALLDDKTSRSGLIVLYVLAHIAFNLGPNVTTFIIPAEIFPTRYRCTCHGIAAAAGKLGSWLVQIFLAYAFQADNPKSPYDREKKHFGKVLQVMSAFMVAGAITTWFLVPETRDHDNKSRTLEVLACGKKVIDELNRQRRREDEDES